MSSQPTKCRNYPLPDFDCLFENHAVTIVENLKMPAVGRSRKRRLLPYLEAMMEFSIQIHRHKKGHKTNPQFNEVEYPLPSHVKKFLKDSLFQLEFSAMLKEYVKLTEMPHCLSNLSVFMRQSFQLHEDPLLKTKFMEWISLICTISVACYENGCKEALILGKDIIQERCESQESLDEFRRLGCDI